MVELLALIGLIVLALVTFNFLKRAGLALTHLGDTILDRLSAGAPVPAPSGKRREINALRKKVEAVKRENEFPEEELKDEIDRLTSQD